MTHPLIIDNFAGGGGASTGIAAAIGRDVDVAINHDEAAIAVHSANHPGTRHFCQSIFAVDPLDVTEGAPVGGIWFSPDCKHHSKAKGGKPRDNQRRGLANVLVKWIDEVRPRIASLENVEEFQDWGDLDERGQPIPEKRGRLFAEFVEKIRTRGYEIEWRELDACDYGTPTTRRRLYMVMRCDGEPITWPAATHGPGLARPWLTVGGCIDWSKEPRSIFGKKPPALNSQKRQAIGFVRYVLGGNPYMVPKGAAWVVKHYTGVIGHDMRRPLGTITTRDHHAVGFAFLVKFYKSGGQWQRCDQPAHTITCKARLGLVQAQAGNDIGAAVRVARWVLRFVPDAPVRWLTVAGRLRPVCVVLADGVERFVVDIGTRMLAPRELARAMGFPDSYELDGTIAQQVERIGNAVCPPVARAIVAANLPAAQKGAA